MRFREKYIRQIIQEEIDQLTGDDSEDSPIEINRQEMAKVLSNVEQILRTLSAAVPATDEEALGSMHDLEKCLEWFNSKVQVAVPNADLDWPKDEEDEQ